MDFYTNFANIDNKIAFRGMIDGKRVTKRIDFEPTLYVPSKQDTGYKSINGENVCPKTFKNVKDARDWVWTQKGIDNFQYYGNENFSQQLIAEVFPEDIKFDLDKILIYNIDIEVNSKSGFPYPTQALWPVTSITLHNSFTNCYYTWAYGPFTPTSDDQIYVHCDDEKDLLNKFLNYWTGYFPDVVTGWNVDKFDMLYLYNRYNNVFNDDKKGKELSPFKQANIRTYIDRSTQSEVTVVNLTGIEQLDYMDMFKKFALKYPKLESYSLDHVCHVVLDEKKLSYEEYGSLHNLYEENHQKYIEYNIRDVGLVKMLDEYLNLIRLSLTMAYKAKTNYGDTLGTTGIWDSLIYHELHKKDVVIPAKKDNHKEKYPGAYVKEPVPGMYSWVTSFDLASLYPNLMVQWNMSPETIMSGIDPEITVEGCMSKMVLPDVDKQSISANGVRFDTSYQGFIPKIISSQYAERKEIKGKQKALEREKELLLAELKELERE